MIEYRMVQTRRYSLAIAANEEQSEYTDSRAMTEFGATVLSLMAERGIRTQKDLAARLKDDHGEQVNARRLSPWLRNVNAPPAWLPRSIREGLNLSEDQTMRLAKAYTFGADRKIEVG